MGNVTMTVNELMWNKFDFGLQDYEIFDESYRETLNTNILEYFKYYEIGFVNPHRWKDELNIRMRRIMRDKFNNLYKTKLVEFNAFHNIDLTETFTREVEGNVKNSNTNTSNSSSETSNESTSDTEAFNTENTKENSISTSSTFPNDSILESEVLGDGFVDSAGKGNSTASVITDSGDLTKVTSESVNTNNSTDTLEGKTESLDKETYTRTTKGSSAGLSFAIALKQFKTEFAELYQLDLEVCKELQDLFLSIY